MCLVSAQVSPATRARAASSCRVIEGPCPPLARVPRLRGALLRARARVSGAVCTYTLSIVAGGRPALCAPVALGRVFMWRLALRWPDRAASRRARRDAAPRPFFDLQLFFMPRCARARGWRAHLCVAVGSRRARMPSRPGSTTGRPHARARTRPVLQVHLVFTR